MNASMFTSCIENDFSLIVASKPIVTTLPDPVALVVALFTMIDALYCEVATLYSERPYSAIDASSTFISCLVYPSV
jgi:hypothetical protein